jgi:glycosyltransferase involved in cell wall biosynthesis
VTHSSAAPTVTVIVPVYNDVKRLGLCLRRLAAQDYEGAVRVVVVDNASQVDLTPALPAGDDRFTMIREERRGSYAARNAGLELVHSDVVAFTDADCQPHTDWLRAAVDALDAPDRPDAVGGAINLVFHGREPRTGPELYEWAHDFNQRSFVEVHGFAATANMVTRHETLRTVGPFNADLQSGGDDDWGHRLSHAGGRMVYSPDAVVDHPARSSWREMTVKRVRVAKGVAALTQGQPAREDLRHYVERARTAAGTVLRIWRREWPDSLPKKATYAAAVTWVSLIDVGVRIALRLRALAARTRQNGVR